LSKIFQEITILEKINIEIGERLKKVRLLLGFSKALPFSEKLGLENPTYGRYENGERSLPDNVKLQLYEMGVNITWLVTGEGEPLLENQKEKIPLIEELQEIIEKTMEPKLGKVESRLNAIESQLKREKDLYSTMPKKEYLYAAHATPAYGDEKEKRIPYVWDIAAGPPITQSDDPGETVPVPFRLLRKGEQYYVASVRGDSMTEAGIRDGDMLLIRCADVPKDGAIQVVRYKDKSTLKRLHKTEEGWELHYEDGSGRVISGDSADYEVQGEFIAVLPVTANLKDK
jgi:SOS-response transcriptional repressor LexA